MRNLCEDQWLHSISVRSYIPPDFDPKNHSTLNSHQGKKHALGKRAKDIDKGILIVRCVSPHSKYTVSQADPRPDLNFLSISGVGHVT